MGILDRLLRLLNNQSADSGAVTSEGQLLYNQGFETIIKTSFKDFMIENNYRTHGSTRFARLINDDYFQYIHFQKAARGEKKYLSILE